MRKKIIVSAAAVAAALSITAATILSGSTGLSGITGLIGKDKAPEAARVRAVALKKGDLAVSVSATGTIYSAQSTSVYSNMNYPIKKVLVSVGDTVKEGDVLAELDISDLELDIVQKKASINSSQATANQNLASAQSDLEIYRRNVEYGYDSNIVNTETSAETAELDVQSAEIDVENAELDVQNAEFDLQNAELDVENATNNLIAARRELREKRDNGDYEDDAELDKLRDNIRSCETAKEKAETNLEKSKASLEKIKANLEKVKSNLEKARIASDKATLNSEVAVLSGKDSIVTYENKVKSAQLNTDFTDQWLAVQKLEAELEKSSIISPVSGTVTSVSAEEGGSGSGLLFIIQDTDNLKILTNIKEYDISSVTAGNKVMVKTDATGDMEFEGKLSKIAPTSTITAEGGAASSSTDAEFESEVIVSSSGKSGLRIGLNAQLSIVTEEKKNIYTVPYDAVLKSRDEAVVYEAKKKEDGSFEARAVPVSTGLENDLYIEIIGDGLSDDMMIISDASGVEEGTPVEIRGAGGESGGGPAGGGQGGAQGGVRIGVPGIGGGPNVAVRGG